MAKKDKSNPDNQQKKPKVLSFLQASPPPMVAGEYVVKAEQAVETGRKKKGTVTYETQRKFYVAAPRFKLDPGAIQNVYPPENKEGSYHQSLPHVVFSQTTLPWARSLGGSPDNPCPWLALLILDEEDIEEAVKQSAAAASKEPTSIIKQVKLDKLIDTDGSANEDISKPVFQHSPKDPGERKPEISYLDPWDEEELKKGKEEGTSYTALDLPVDLFFDIAPQIKDLPFTAHARHIDTEERPHADLKADGWLSILIGNRQPTPGKKHTVFLVSLEGHLNLLIEGQKRAQPHIRLCVLHYWSFTEGGLNFAEMVEQINDGVDVLKVKQDPSETENVKAKKTAESVLSYGYVPVDHHFRDGSDTVSWYRGPLVPLHMNKRGDQFIYSSPDKLLLYDPSTGMMDTSYSAAWQLGRLLGLQNQEYAKALQQWSEQMRKETMAQRAKKILQDKGISSEELEDILQELERNELMQSLLYEDYKASKAPK